MLKKIKSFAPNLGESWLLIVIIVIGGGIIGGVLALILSAIFPSVNSWISILLYPVMFVPGFIYIYFRPVDKGEIVNKFPVNSYNFGKQGLFLSLLFTVPLILAFNLVTEPLYSWMKMPQFIKELFEKMNETTFISFLTVVIFAPLLEELFLRGIVLRGLLVHYSPKKAIIWSAIIFGFMHLNPWQAVPAILVGLLMGWIYYKTGSLLMTIFIHFINNGFSFLIMALLPSISLESSYRDIIPGNFYYVVFVVSIIYIAVTLTIMNKKYDKPLSN